MKQYKALIERVIREGEVRNDRTGVGTVGIFGHTMEFDLNAGFPLVTGKYTNIKNIADELRWFLSGSTNVADLNSGIWDAWKLEDGTIGPSYGWQWRHCPKIEVGDGYYEPCLYVNGEVDQIQNLIDGLINDTWSRRHILNSWNVGMLHMMALTPCHVMAHFHVSRDYKLSCILTQRSADVFLGLPYNIASYAMLTHLLARRCKLGVGKLVINTGDTHLYLNHIDQVHKYMAAPVHLLPTLSIGHVSDDLREFGYYLENYEHGPAIKAAVAV